MSVYTALLLSHWLEPGHVVVLIFKETGIHVCVCLSVCLSVCSCTQLKFESQRLLKRKGVTPLTLHLSNSRLCCFINLV